MSPGNVAFDATSHDYHHVDTERRELNAESVTVSVKSSLGCIVCRAEDVGDDCSHAANLEYGTLGANEKRSKSLAHSQDGEESGFKCTFDF